MPVKNCEINGRPGWKWGNEGKCYPGPAGKSKAIAQGIAIEEGAFACVKVSVDYDDTASTEAGKELIEQLLDENKDVYIISARNSKIQIVNDLKDYLPPSKIFATGSNRMKIEKIKSLNVRFHYDNNKLVIDDVNDLTNTRGILFNG